MPRRHRNAGYRPRGPRSLAALRAELGLPSDRARSVPVTDNARADADEAWEATSTKYRDRSNGRHPVNNRLPQPRPPARTARVHVPPHELGQTDERHELRELDRTWVRDRVSCPRCGAAVGMHCRGRSLRRSNHLERLMEAWVPRG